MQLKCCQAGSGELLHSSSRASPVVHCIWCAVVGEHDAGKDMAESELQQLEA